MGVEQEWAVPFRAEYRDFVGERFSPLYGRATYANDLIRALYHFRFDDGSQPFLWIGRNTLQPNSYVRGLLRNGGFIEHQWNHIETSTPECRNHWELTKYDRANEVWVYISCLEFKKREGIDIDCWKANVDAKGMSRATHESYNCDRTKIKVNEGALIPYFVFRQIFAGSGGFWRGDFLLSPRAMVLDQVESKYAGARCILHTYDEPLMPPTLQRYRSHQGFGDGLRSEVSNLLKFGITSFVLSALEEGLLKKVELEDALSDIKAISWNTQGPWRVKVGTQKLDALDYLSSYVLEAIERLFEQRKVHAHDRYTVDKFKFVLEKLKAGLLEDLRNDVQWEMMKYFLENYLDHYAPSSKGYGHLEKRIAASLDFTNVAHDDVVWLEILDGLLPEEGEEHVKELRASRLFTDEEVRDAVLFPPPFSRADLRVALASIMPLIEIDWHVALKPGAFRFTSLGGLDGWDKEKIGEKVMRIRDERY